MFVYIIINYRVPKYLLLSYNEPLFNYRFQLEGAQLPEEQKPISKLIILNTHDFLY